MITCTEEFKNDKFTVFLEIPMSQHVDSFNTVRMKHFEDIVKKKRFTKINNFIHFIIQLKILNEMKIVS